MARPSQTYLIAIDKACFDRITQAIMVQSRRAGKLQGFGQCLTTWLERWSVGEIPIGNATSEPSNPSSHRRDKHQIYVGLGHDSTNILKNIRIACSKQADTQVTIAMAIVALTEAFLANTE